MSTVRISCLQLSPLTFKLIDMLRVGVARGGPGNEYEASLIHGEAVLRALADMPDEFEPVDILVDREGTWHVRGMPVTIDTFAPRVDIVWNALHGEYGENGELTQILDERGIPHTSAPSLTSRTALNKAVFRKYAEKNGMKVPDAVSIDEGEARDAEELTREIHSHIPPPWVVKYTKGGHSVGVALARSVPELELAIESALQVDEPFIVEQYLYGREIIGGVLKDFRGQTHYPLMPMEAKKKGIFEHASRMAGEVPLILLEKHEEEKAQIAQFFRDLDKELPLGFTTTGDFIRTPRGLYLIEIDAQPSVFEHSPIVHSLAHVGATIHDYVRGGIEFAKAKTKNR